MRIVMRLVVALSMSGAMTCAAEPASQQLEHFERAIRPLLVEHCYECHSGTASAESAHLRLDYTGGWATGGDSGPAINHVAPDTSLLLKAIEYNDPDLQMPPRSKLPEQDLATLRGWILAGAVAPDEAASQEQGAQTFDIAARRAAHWAWQPVTHPTPPPVLDSAWPRDAIDRFILAKLEAAGLAPAADADPASWLRRVTFDLTGLPPAPDEVRQFVADPSPAARQQVVERLLTSRAFAECWATHWLDLFRFAESRGHEQDFDIPHAWRYRDYVIRALEANVPYDQFVVEHIAGDLLAEPRIDPATKTNQSIQATAWWHLGEATHSPVDIRGEEADRIDNQIDVFGKAFLGMTVACARCHDHKFDAIGTADYYALCGYIQSSSYQEANVADPALHQQLAAEFGSLHDASSRELLSVLRSRLDAVRKSGPKLDNLPPDQLDAARQDISHPLHAHALARDAEDVMAAVREYATSAATPPPAWQGQVVVDFQQTVVPTHDDWLTSGWCFGPSPLTVGRIALPATADEPLRAIERPCAASHGASSKLTGLYRTKTFAVTAPTVWYLYRGAGRALMDVDSHRTFAGPLHMGLQQTLEKSDSPRWFRQPSGDYLGHRVHVDFHPEGDFELLAVVVAEEAPPTPVTPNTAVQAALRSLEPVTADEVAAATLHACDLALQAVADGRATGDDARLVNWLVSESPWMGTPSDEQLAIVDRHIAQRAEIEARIPKPQWSLALLDGSAENESIHLRGSHKRVAPEPTPRRFLEALGGNSETCAGSGRLHLAQQVASTENPLTARVHVNRVWGYLTGRGIARTVDNLGVLGEAPTHPELLDYLASEFVASGWDTRALVRRIVLSRTYGQGGITSEQAREVDPSNTLLHAARVKRLPAEAVRDTLLAVAGRLNDQAYGPSVRIHITDFMRHNRSPEWSGPLDGDCRRSVYVEVRRNAMSHFLAAFDRPQPFSTMGARNVSNSPAQPLTLLNDPLVHQLTASWAQKLVTDHATDKAAIADAYLTAFGREATRSEAEQLHTYIHNAPSREQAWSEVCLALVNSKEFVFLR